MLSRFGACVNGFFFSSRRRHTRFDCDWSSDRVLFVDVVLNNLGNQWIAVPWSNHVYLNSVYVLPSWVLLYSLLAIPFGQIITRVLKYVRFRRRLEKMGVPLRPGPAAAA